MTKLVQWSALPLCLALAGCSGPEIDIVIQRDGETITAELSQDWGIVFSDIQVPCIDWIELSRAEGGEVEVIWKATYPNVNCVDLERFTVGVAPPEFANEVPLDPDFHGEASLTVIGIGGGSGEVTLVI